MAPGFSPEVPVALELPADLAQAQGYSASSRRQGAERSCANRSRRVRVVNRHVSPPWAVKLWVLLPPSGRHLFKNGLCSLWANRPKRSLGARKRRSLTFEAGARPQSTSELYRLPRVVSMHRVGFQLFRQSRIHGCHARCPCLRQAYRNVVDENPARAGIVRTGFF
jgi:hypothetical protein